jgi:hypothetical protein
MPVAVRALKKQVSHHHFKAPRPNHLRYAKQFLKVLEKLRKRAQASAIKEIGKEQCDSISQRWQSYIKWLRQVALRCNCRKKPTGTKRLNQMLIDAILVIAERELRGMEAYADEIPDRTTFRHWARAFMRSVRLGRIHVDSIHQLTTTPAGASQISIYMRERIWKQRKE